MLKAIKTFVQKIFPSFSRKIYFKINSFRYAGGKYYCPICENGFREYLYGPEKRSKSKCPGCGSLERQRLLWLYLKNKIKIEDKKINLLNIAPDYAIQSKLKSLKNISYISVDINSSLAMQKADITSLNFDDNTFDAVLCYHVLEHIEDDKKALSEIYRVLKKNGWAILQTPIDIEREITFEDFTVKLPGHRKQIFGQEDHVRIYGRDYTNRLQDAGFIVTEDDFINSFTLAAKEKYQLDKSKIIYFCNKNN